MSFFGNLDILWVFSLDGEQKNNWKLNDDFKTICKLI